MHTLAVSGSDCPFIGHFLRVQFDTHTHTRSRSAMRRGGGRKKKVSHEHFNTRARTKQHTLLQLYQHLRLVRLQLVLDEWAHKMPLSHFPCCQISQQSEGDEFSLWRDWDKDDGGGGGGGGGVGGRQHKSFTLFTEGRSLASSHPNLPSVR